MKDIAEIAEVSVPTVSLVLSGKGRISSDVRDRVMKVASELGYFHNQNRFDDKQHSNRNIGMLYSFDMEWSHVHTFLGPMITTIEDILRSCGHYLSLIALTKAMPTEEILNRILRDNLKAVFSVHFADETLFNKLEQLGIPVIIVNNLEYQDVFQTAGVDNFQGSYEAVKYLQKMGHKKIAYCDYPRADLPTIVKMRYLGYQAAMSETGTENIQDLHIRVGIDDNINLEKQLKKLLQPDDRPSALFIHDDYQGRNVLHILDKWGMKVPEDLSIIAHGDTQDYDKIYTPMINTMKINTGQLGKLAAELLIERLKSHDSEIQVVKLKEVLVDRGSCASLKSSG